MAPNETQLTEGRQMKIAQIREIIRRAEHLRGWLTGGTSEEFRRQTVGPQLAEKVAELEALQIPARFAADEEQRVKEIGYCKKVIARWEAAQGEPAADALTCDKGGPRHVYLGSKQCELCGRIHPAHVF